MTRDRPAVPATGLAEHFLRHEAGRLIAHLTARFGAARLQQIEDAVQTALLCALTSWGPRGVPDNPSAWLTRIARNRLIDQLRRVDREVATCEADLLEEQDGASPAEVVFGREIEDDELRMLFVCCDPELPERTQLVLSLKLLGGFSAREIAARLFLREDNVLQILSRGRARLRKLWQTPESGWSSPPPDSLTARLPQVRSVIYLLFNEGYSSQDDDQVIRRELCAEALRLAQRLVAHPVGDDGASWALLSLMHFHQARLDARIDGQGDLLMLAEQDRSKWDAEEIGRGMAALMRASSAETFCRYLGEAAILAEHCLAPSFEATRWGEIVELYELLERHCGPSPLYTLNRAIALAEWRGPQAGLALLESLTPPAWLARYYLWDAALGDLLRRDGQHTRARRHLERALQAAPTRAERRMFERRLAQPIE